MLPGEWPPALRDALDRAVLVAEPAAQAVALADLVEHAGGELVIPQFLRALFDQALFVSPCARLGNMEITENMRKWRKRCAGTLRNYLDRRRDLRICGMSLEVFAPATSGSAVDTISAPYRRLEEVLGAEEFTPEDRLLDVGCGMGRPLAYLASTGFPGELVGIELNAEVVQAARMWTSRYPNVRILAGDAFGLDLSGYTRFFMWYPMVPPVLERFVEKMERELAGPASVYYLGERGGEVFEGRAGWTLLRQGSAYRVMGYRP